jgi:hypothetical protein
VYVVNIIDTYLRANDEDIDAGIHWYDSTRALALEWANGDLWKGAGIIAAYSPQTPWWRTKELARISLQNGIAEPGHMFSNKAQAILDGAPVLPTLNGPKITAFASAIADPDSQLVTVDVHAYSIAMGKRFTNPKFGIRVYRAIADAYRECAELAGHSPSQFQAITWVNWRRRHPHKAARQEAYA